MELGENPTDDEILHFVDAWVDDLARGDFTAAFDRTSHDPHREWSPWLIQQVIAGYGLPEPNKDGTEFKVTPREGAAGRPFERRVDRVESYPVLAYAYCSLPLNGEWSDLTASFRIESARSGAVATLEEIHVF